MLHLLVTAFAKQHGHPEVAARRLQRRVDTDADQIQTECDDPTAVVGVNGFPHRLVLLLASVVITLKHIHTPNVLNNRAQRLNEPDAGLGTLRIQALLHANLILNLGPSVGHQLLDEAFIAHITGDTLVALHGQRAHYFDERHRLVGVRLPDLRRALNGCHEILELSLDFGLQNSVRIACFLTTLRTGPLGSHRAFICPRLGGIFLAHGFWNTLQLTLRHGNSKVGQCIHAFDHQLTVRLANGGAVLVVQLLKTFEQLQEQGVTLCWGHDYKLASFVLLPIFHHLKHHRVVVLLEENRQNLNANHTVFDHVSVHLLAVDTSVFLRIIQLTENS